MQIIWANAGMLTVAMLFLHWRTYVQVRVQRHERLRERVVYMLWVMAQRGQPPGIADRRLTQVPSPRPAVGSLPFLRTNRSSTHPLAGQPRTKKNQRVIDRPPWLRID